MLIPSIDLIDSCVLHSCYVMIRHSFAQFVYQGEADESETEAVWSDMDLELNSQ